MLDEKMLWKAMRNGNRCYISYLNEGRDEILLSNNFLLLCVDECILREKKKFIPYIEKLKSLQGIDYTIKEFQIKNFGTKKEQWEQIGEGDSRLMFSLIKLKEDQGGFEECEKTYLKVDKELQRKCEFDDMDIVRRISDGKYFLYQDTFFKVVTGYRYEVSDNTFLRILDEECVVYLMGLIDAMCSEAKQYLK